MPHNLEEPLLSSSEAHLLSFLFALCYVGSIYVSNGSRLSYAKDDTNIDERYPRVKVPNERWRDDPDVIQARLLAVTLASIACCIAIFVLLWHLTGLEHWGKVRDLTLLHLGWTCYATLPHLITPVLFLGPMYATYLSEELPFQRFWTFQSHVVDRFFSWTGLRTYIMGPITEEIVFRACILTLYHLSGASRTRMIFLTPLTFGLAHVHHAWDTYNRYGRTEAAAQRAIIGTLFQLAYTTLFGFHVAYLFLRTGSILPAITAHAFCNTMGFPEIQYELYRFQSRKRSIISAYLLGMVLFVCFLPKWTMTEGSLYWRPGTSI